MDTITLGRRPYQLQAFLSAGRNGSFEYRRVATEMGTHGSFMAPSAEGLARELPSVVAARLQRWGSQKRVLASG